MSGELEDLSQLDVRKGSEDGREIALRHPGSGGELKARVHVRGYDSDSYRLVSQTHQRRRLERLPMHRPTPEEIRHDSLELSAALVAGWKNLSLDGGKTEFPYSPANALTILEKFPWVREQIESAAADRANFLPGSSSGSAGTQSTGGA